MSKKYLIIASFIGLSFFLAGLAAFRSPYLEPAQTGAGGFGISPPLVTAELRPGEIYRQNVNLLRSDARSEQMARLKIRDSELSSWVTVEPAAELKIPAGEEKTPVSVAVRVPADAVSGTYYGTINITWPAESKVSGVGLDLGARLDLRIAVSGGRDPAVGPAGAESSPVRLAAAESGIFERLRGFVVMRAEARGEAYYVDPAEPSLYFLGRPEDAFLVMRGRGIGLTAGDLAHIPCAVTFPADDDRDGDGLPDIVESALGTDSGAADSDDDGFDDLTELAGGFDPLREGAKLAFDRKLIDRLKGRVLLDVTGNGEAWYLHPGDGQRYYLGRPDYAWQVLKQTAVGISENDFESLIAR